MAELKVIGVALAWLLVLTAATLGAAGCSGGEESTSSSTAVTLTTVTPGSTATSAIPATTSTTGSQPVATLGENDIHELAGASWSPPESIPEAEVEGISDALSTHDLRTLFPSAVPFATNGPVLGDFIMQWVPATGVIDLIVRVGTDHGAWVALWSSPTESEAVTFGTEDTARATEVVVRGQPGLVFPRSDETTQIISWQEEGQYFVVWHRWLPEELTAQQVIGWLESWYWLP